MKALAAVAICLGLIPFAAFAAEGAKESAYERVMRTGELRCGYVTTETLKKDPNTGKVSGIMYEITEEAARLLSLKVVWQEELSWATYIEAMRAKRVDAFCSNIWMEPIGGKYLTYTIPLFYSGVGAYVRADDTRFDSGKLIDLLNKPEVRISTVDGDMSDLIASQDFPKATKASLTQMGDASQLLLQVATGKADLAFTDVTLGNRFSLHNPGKIKNVVPSAPIRVFSNAFAMMNDEVRLKSMLDSALVQMLYGGFIDRVLDKHSDDSSGYYRVAKPYALPTARH